MSEFPVPEAMAAMQAFTETRPGYRRAHARGLVVRGTFQATPALAAVSVAEHFQGGVVKVVARFSNAGGNPFGADRTSDSAGRVLGLGIRFALPSGAVASWAAASLPSFPARTPEDFLKLTALQKPLLSLRPNPFRLLAYLASRPSAWPAIKAIAQLKPAASFAAVAFNGLHTYVLVDRNGQRMPFRYRWEPRLKLAPLTPAQARALPKQYLLDELRTRLQAPASWDLVLQLPQAGDPLDDATRAWPAARDTVSAGTLTLSELEADQRASEPLVFDPTGVVPGIELSDDPLLRFRAAVYSESFLRRSQETRGEACPVDMGQ